MCRTRKEVPLACAARDLAQECTVNILAARGFIKSFTTRGTQKESYLSGIPIQKPLPSD